MVSQPSELNNLTGSVLSHLDWLRQNRIGKWLEMYYKQMKDVLSFGALEWNVPGLQSQPRNLGNLEQSHQLLDPQSHLQMWMTGAYFLARVGLTNSI